MAQRLYALRGAVSVPKDDSGEILDATSELMSEIMYRNALEPPSRSSAASSRSPTISTAEFPAVAARALGFERVPLLCAREIPVPGSLPRVIRVLIHYYAPEDHEPAHVYLREAASLRADLQAAQ